MIIANQIHTVAPLSDSTACGGLKNIPSIRIGFFTIVWSITTILKIVVLLPRYRPLLALGAVGKREIV